MIPPMISFITFNRAGINAINLKALLQTTDDFELHIVDNGSEDSTWEFVNSLKDSRIKSRKLFDVNYGITYALNYTLSKRKKDQYFISVDSDVNIKTSDWVSQFLGVMNAFPKVGLLGAYRDNLFEEKEISPKLLSSKDIFYYEYSYITGCCICIRPEVLDLLGYFNEETGGADMDMCMRMNMFTPYSTGFIPSIKINQTQRISCKDCLLKNKCTLDKDSNTCFQIYNNKYKHRAFSKIIGETESPFLREVALGNRSAYCASIHDPNSVEKHTYNTPLTYNHFRFFILNDLKTAPVLKKMKYIVKIFKRLLHNTD